MTANGLTVEWTEARDARLMDAIGAGLTFRAAGILAGVSRDAAIGRFHRIAARYGDQAK